MHDFGMQYSVSAVVVIICSAILLRVLYRIAIPIKTVTAIHALESCMPLAFFLGFLPHPYSFNFRVVDDIDEQIRILSIIDEVLESSSCRIKYIVHYDYGIAGRIQIKNVSKVYFWKATEAVKFRLMIDSYLFEK